MNWGMRRCIERDNHIQPSSNEFAYTLDGTGVDVVIQDTGVQPISQNMMMQTVILDYNK